MLTVALLLFAGDPPDYRRFPCEEACRAAYNLACQRQSEAETPMGKAHYQFLKDLYWACWWTTWGRPDAEWPVGETRAKWAAKCREMVGERNFRMGLWPEVKP
jgi:hypothetical protein